MAHNNSITASSSCMVTQLHNSSSLFPHFPTSAACVIPSILSIIPSIISLSQVALFICSHGLHGLGTFGTVCFNFQGVGAEPLLKVSQLHRRRRRPHRQFQAFLTPHHRERAGAQRALGEVGIRALSAAVLHLDGTQWEGESNNGQNPVWMGATLSNRLCCEEVTISQNRCQFLLIVLLSQSCPQSHDMRCPSLSLPMSQFGQSPAPNFPSLCSGASPAPGHPPGDSRGALKEAPREMS